MQQYEIRDRDAVCGRQVTQIDPKLQTEYADVIYRFCSQECMDRFIEQPDIFTAEAGRGTVASRDRALRDDDLVGGEVRPEATAALPHEPPAADPGG